MTDEKTIATCIICRQNVACESKEHVFPDTIGGAITIKICDPCNKSLGKRIDTPFVNSELILGFRNRYNLRRDNWRDIKNPFKNKKIVDEEGREYYVLMENGIATKNIKPIYEPPIDLGNSQYFFKVSMPIKDIPADPKELLKTLEKRLGIEIPNKDTYMVHTEKMQEENSVIQLEISHKIKIFEYVKIAYELACSISKEYFNDSRAVLISNILHKGEITNENGMKIFTPEEALQDLIWFENRFHFLKQNPEFVHIALFSQSFDGRLKAYIRIFNLPLVITLSDERLNFIEKELLFFNDSKERKGNFADVTPIHFQMPTYDLRFDEKVMSEMQKIALLEIIKVKGANWVKREGKEIIFTISGEETQYTIHTIHARMTKSTTEQRNTELCLFNFELPENTFFLKYESIGVFFPLKSIIYHLKTDNLPI